MLNILKIAIVALLIGASASHAATGPGTLIGIIETKANFIFHVYYGYGRVPGAKIALYRKDNFGQIYTEKLVTDANGKAEVKWGTSLPISVTVTTPGFNTYRTRLYPAFNKANIYTTIRLSK